jgi:hypothetical protein
MKMGLIKKIKQILIVRSLKKNVFKSNLTNTKQDEKVFSLVFFLHSMYLILLDDKSIISKNIDKYWKLERAYILYYISTKLISFEDINISFEMRNEMEDKVLDWLIYVYESTYNSKDQQFLWDFDERREELYDKYFDEEFLYTNRNDLKLIPKDLEYVLNYNLFICPGVLNISDNDIYIEKMNFDNWSINYMYLLNDIKFVIKPFYKNMYLYFLNSEYLSFKN